MGSRTYTSHNVSRMIEDEYIKPTASMAVYSYVMSEDSKSTSTSAKSLTDYIAEAKQNSIIPKFKAAVRYSKTPGYAYGQLRDNIQSTTPENMNRAIERYALAKYGSTATIKYVMYSHTNFMHCAMWQLQQFYRHNSLTNEVVAESELTGFPVYLENVEVLMPDARLTSLDSFNQITYFGPSPTGGYTPFRPALASRWYDVVTTDNTVNDVMARVTFCYADALGAKKTYTKYLDYTNFIAPLPDPNKGDDTFESNIVDSAPRDREYLYSYFTVTVNGVVIGEYVMYRTGSQQNADLESIFTTSERFGTFVPRMYARMNGQALNHESLEGSAKYKSMVKLGKKFGMKWSSWVDEIHDGMSDLRYVREIFMTAAVQVNNEKPDPIIDQYLFHYFKELYNTTPEVTMYNTEVYYSTTQKQALAEWTALVQEAVSVYNARQGTGIFLQDREHSSGFQYSGIGYARLLGTKSEVGKYTSGFSTGVHWYRFQETATSYIEVRVYGLASYDVLGSSTSHMPSGDSEDLVIPLDLSITANLTVSELETLYAKSLQIVVNTSQTVKKKWYQTGIFKVVMFIVAVVISYFFPPAGIALQGAMAVAYAVGVAVAVSVAVTLVTKLLINMGVDGGLLSAIMLVIAIIALAYGGYLNMSGATGAGGITAQTVLMASNAAFSMSNMGNQLQMAKMLSAYESTMAALEEKAKELKELMISMGLLAVPSPQMIIFESPNSLDIRLGESPDSYYDRTIHTGNVGTIVYDYQESYVDIGLQLPTLDIIMQNLEQVYE